MYLYEKTIFTMAIDTHGMKIVVNKVLPFKGFKALCLLKWIWVKPGTILTQRDFNHEATHYVQQKEMWYVFFYLLYGLEWLIKYSIVLDAKKAYYLISFEREAYENDTYKNWIQERPRFYWLKYLFKV